MNTFNQFNGFKNDKIKLYNIVNAQQKQQTNAAAGIAQNVCSHGIFNKEIGTHLILKVY